jgi:hypothetical protein
MQGDPADLFALMNEDADLSSTLLGLVSPLLGLGEAKVHCIPFLGIAWAQF